MMLGQIFFDFRSLHRYKFALIDVKYNIDCLAIGNICRKHFKTLSKVQLDVHEGKEQAHPPLCALNLIYI